VNLNTVGVVEEAPDAPCLTDQPGSHPSLLRDHEKSFSASCQNIEVNSEEGTGPRPPRHPSYSEGASGCGVTNCLSTWAAPCSSSSHLRLRQTRVPSLVPT
jgi:hypothetical protein